MEEKLPSTLPLPCPAATGKLLCYLMSDYLQVARIVSTA